MKNSVVIGLGCGDEGKGRVVDWLCEKDDPSLVVRFSGGQQAAHHVVHENGADHVFANFGSGTLRGIPTYFSEFCTIDPMGILNELEFLKNKGVSPTLYINGKCPVTTTFDKAKNISNNKLNGHGSCGVGFGATLQREEDHYSLLFEDLFHPAALYYKTFSIAEYYSRQGTVPSPIDETLRVCRDLIQTGCVKEVSGMPLLRETVFEGSQGILLDQKHGFFPHVTRSNTGMTNVNKICPPPSPDVYLVTRAYQTRHGAGPMTNEGINHGIPNNPFEKNFANEHQGPFRTALLDLDLLKYSAMKVQGEISSNSNVTLVITCLDQMTNNWRLTLGGKTLAFTSEYTFVRKIADELPNIHELLLSRSAIGGMEEW